MKGHPANQPQFTVRRLFGCTAIVGVPLLFAREVAPRSYLSGPLFLTGTGHDENTVIGWILALVIGTAAMAYPLYQNRLTAFISIGALILWLALGVVIRSIADW